MEFASGKLRFFLCLVLALALAGSAQAAPCKVVFVPGAFGQGKSSLFLDSRDYFAEYESFFRAHGCETAKIEFPGDATVELRARILKDAAQRLIQKDGDGSAVIIAHSEGGLDARFALKSLGLTGISALITIGTPNEGTPLADWVVQNRQSESPLYWFLRVFGSYDLKRLSFLGEMTESFLDAHAEMFAKVQGVKYASARAVCRTDCHWALRLLDWVSGARGGLGTSAGGDGIIPTDRQEFGTDLGEYDLDHISEVSADPIKRAERQRFLERVLAYLQN